ncbi:hypothetical protein [Lentilactobacillus kefiri]|nr:hypothetical protein [Lentilactobacillus kefiri]
MNTVVITTKSHDSIFLNDANGEVKFIGDTIFSIDRRDIMSVLFK